MTDEDTLAHVLTALGAVNTALSTLEREHAETMRQLAEERDLRSRLDRKLADAAGRLAWYERHIPEIGAAARAYADNERRLRGAQRHGVLALPTTKVS